MYFEAFKILMKMNRIDEVLEEQGRTKKWLAEKLNRSQNTVTNWTNQKSQPSLEDIIKISKLLSVEISNLIIDTNKGE